MDYSIDQTDMERLQAFIDGKDPNVLFTELPERLFRLAEAVRRQSLEESRKAIRTKASLEKRLDRFQVSKEKDYQQGQFGEANRDSLEVAYAIKHVANEAGYFIKKNMLILLLYDVYANWLYSGKERLTDEEPKATAMGPQFWKVFKKIDMKLSTNQTRQYYRSLTEYNPGIVAIIKNVVNKYILMDESRVASIMKSNDAYRNASKENNDGKWNKTISAADIYQWKKDKNNP